MMKMILSMTLSAMMFTGCHLDNGSDSQKPQPAQVPQSGQVNVPPSTELPLPTSEQKPLPSPSLILGKKLKIWATWYSLPTLTALSSGGIAIEDGNKRPLGVRLSEKDYCRCAMEGSCIIGGKVYNYDSSGSKKYANCSHGTGYTRFNLSKWPYGTGSKSNPLTPFKSIAADPSFLPFGTTIYIPSAKGNKYKFDGKELLHDGVFVVEDIGGAIKGNHIDVYIGAEELGNPFAWVKSTSSGTFEAFIVEK